MSPRRAATRTDLASAPSASSSDGFRRTSVQSISQGANHAVAMLASLGAMGVKTFTPLNSDRASSSGSGKNLTEGSGSREGSKPELRLDGLLASKVLTGFKQSDKKRGGRRCTCDKLTTELDDTVTAVAFSTVFERRFAAATVSGSLSLYDSTTGVLLASRATGKGLSSIQFVPQKYEQNTPEPAGRA